MGVKRRPSDGLGTALPNKKIRGKDVSDACDSSEDETLQDVAKVEDVNNGIDNDSDASDGNHADEITSPGELHASYQGGGLLDLSLTFAEFGERHLDRRLTKAVVTTLGLKHPTLVQSSAIPLLLQGKDVLARARTGSGKTLAYSLPMLQRLLEKVAGETSETASPLQACVLVPTRELCVQVSEVCTQLCEYCRSQISVRHLSESLNQLVSEVPPTVIIATPKSLLTYLSAKQSIQPIKATAKKSFWRNRSKNLGDLKSTFKTNLQIVVLDEADALMTLGFKQDLEVLFKDILGDRTTENRYQAVLCSATLNSEVSSSCHSKMDMPIDD
ncbi:probable ATP-dependent RNA helicase DDX56 [Condylostylus longicornis]|uniref:probable ATP-dependent RNA helicase DDX56 n=1 Tax=Condylostylus longicornis TaxID=2530218 RepID=UPI00244DC9FC|nr:probable ATP-dependent RNA helicase DDX56 [Condylostylus longicornis]